MRKSLKLKKREIFRIKQAFCFAFLFHAPLKRFWMKFILKMKLIFFFEF